jgi:hypothetical protein
VRSICSLHAIRAAGVVVAWSVLHVLIQRPDTLNLFLQRLVC